MLAMGPKSGNRHIVPKEPGIAQSWWERKHSKQEIELKHEHQGRSGPEFIHAIEIKGFASVTKPDSSA